MGYIVIDHCPAPAKLVPSLRRIKDKTGCVYLSIYRGKDARAILEANGKHDQAWIFAHYPPGVANPPGRSTHELKNDGSAYRGWMGMPLRWWQCGIDVDNAHVAAFIKAANEEGWIASITYPTSKIEYHHVNFRKEPKIKIRSIRIGARGPMVKVMTRRLAFVRTPDHKHSYLSHSYWTFTRDVENALKQYQKDHKQKADGIFGPQTARQLDTSTRFWKQKRK